MNSTLEIINRGVNCLIREMGVVETEKFIAIINREKFDYTKWQRNLFEEMDFDELNQTAAMFGKNNSF